MTKCEDVNLIEILHTWTMKYRNMAFNSEDPLNALSLLPLSSNILPFFSSYSANSYSYGILSHVMESWGDISLQSIRNKNPYWMFEVAGSQRGCGP